MNKKTKDLYSTKVDDLLIWGGITSKGEPSMILEDSYVALKMDGEAKLQAIFECIVAVVSKTSSSKGR